MSDDVGYFGPDSQTWRIHGEPVAMIGGLRALLLQALHPGAMAVLDERSDFRADPWRRLESTVRYVATVSFAPRAEADDASARVRAVHRALRIDDPDQLTWVHLCLVDSFLVGARAAGLGLSHTEADDYVHEQAVAADLVGVPPARVPTDVASLRSAIEAFRPGLRATAAARDAARVVLAPPIPVPLAFALPARVGWTSLSALALGLMPPWALRLYRLPPVPGRTFAAAAALRGLRRAVRTLPERYREGPLYRDAKARAALAG